MNPKKIIINTLIMAFLSSFFLIKLIATKVNPIIYRYSTVEAKHFTTILINSSVSRNIAKNIDEDLFKVEKDSSGNIQMLDYNTKKVNNLLEKITKNVQDELLNLEHGKIDNLNVSDSLKGKKFSKVKSGVVCELPTSSIFSNSLLANIGPTIPIKLSFVGAVVTNLNTKVKSYGINNLFLEVNIHIEIDERITMPMMTKEIKVAVDIPLTMKVIQGKIPNYYYQNGLVENSNSYSLPITN